MKRSIALSLVTLIGCTSSQIVNGLRAAELLRGPYLQAATADGITLRWRTDVPTRSMVGYGTNSLSLVSTDETLTTDHVMRLSGLTPRTKYFYSIGSGTQRLAQGPDCQFATPPAPGDPHPTRIWVTGDTGGFSLGATNVIGTRDAYLAYTGTRPTDIWLLLGDNAYNEGTEFQYQRDFFNIYGAMLRNTVPWPTIGNHETYCATNGWFPYLNIFSVLTNGESGGVASGTVKYYSFDHANIHFISLDAMTQSRGPNSEMANWLRADLEATTQQWKIAFWHHPPYSKGSHDSDYEVELMEMRQNMLPILEAHGVDLVLSGHSHNYERSYLLRGHYGSSGTLQPSMILDHGSGREQEGGAYVKPTTGPFANQGTIYLVTGNSASRDERIGHHPAMFIDEQSEGSVVIDVNTNRLDAVFLRATGAIFDQFTIIKQDPEPLRFTSFVVQDGNTIARWSSIRGLTYRVEQTDNLETPNWQPIGDLIVAPGANTTWTNAVDLSAPASFYRVSQLP
jgi:hypothetical protein